MKQLREPRSPNLIDMTRAGMVFGVSSKRLLKLLRDHKYINKENIAYQEHVSAGLFQNELRQHRLPGTDINRYYSVCLVTSLGISLIASILRNESEQQQPVAAHG